jgi:Zn-finger protein
MMRFRVTINKREEKHMINSHQYFKNESCKYFPCHTCEPGADFNCLFCYCPMNPYPDCPGQPVYRQGKSGRMIKDCTTCTFPHDPAHYEEILEFLRKNI